MTYDRGLHLLVVGGVSSSPRKGPPKLRFTAAVPVGYAV